MGSDVRACIAYVVLRLVSGRNAPAIYDYTASQYISIDGQVTPTRVDIYDYSRGAYFAGNGDGGRFELYDYGHARRIDLYVIGNRYEGYDHGTSSNFSGSVNGTAAQLFDYGGSGNFNYSL